MVIKLTLEGERRVLDGRAGMTFIVDSMTPSGQPKASFPWVAHVRDYRYASDRRDFQIWSLGPQEYEFISGEKYSPEEMTLLTTPEPFFSRSL